MTERPFTRIGVSTTVRVVEQARGTLPVCQIRISRCGTRSVRVNRNDVNGDYLVAVRGFLLHLCTCDLRP